MLDFEKTVNDYLRAAVLRIDRQWRIVAATDAVSDFVAKSAGELLGRELSVLEGKVDGLPLEIRCRELLARRQRTTVAVALAGARSSFTLRFIPEEDGVVLILSDLVDADHHRATENELRLTVEQLDVAFNGLPFMIASLDCDFNFVRVNWAYASQVGKNPADFPGQNHFDLYPDPENEAIFRQVRDTGRPVKYSAKPFHYSEAPETVRYFDWGLFPVKDTNETVSGILLSIREVTAEEQTRRALVEQEALLRKVFEHVPVGLALVNPAMAAQKVNPAYCAFFGTPEADLVGAPIADFFHPDDRELALNWIAGRRAGTDDVEVRELRFLHRDGTTQWGRVSGAWINDEKTGEVIFGLGMILDISAQKRTDDLFVRLKQRYQAIFNSAKDGIGYAALDGTVLDSNPAICKMLGYSLEELDGVKKFTEFTPPEYHDMEAARIGEMMTTGEPVTYQKELLRRDGSRFPVEVSVFQANLPSGETLGIGAILRDISDRRQMEEQLRASEERSRLLLESSGEAIYGVDIDGRCIFANPKCLQMTGYAEEQELLGKNMHELIHHHHADGQPYAADECKIYQAFKEGAGTHVDDEVFWRTDGSSFPVEYWSNPIVRGGDIIGSVINFNDISARKEAEQQLRTTLAEKELLYKEVHHRVKNNLQIISGLLYLQANLLNDPLAEGKLHESRNRVDTMAMLHELLYSSEALAQLDFNDYLQRLVAYLTESYFLSARKIVLECDCEHVKLDLDTMLLCGMVINELVTNALKYAFPEKSSGRVTVALHAADAPHQLSLRVRDNGVGFPAGGSSRQPGSLGVWLVESLVEQLDGRIEFKNDNGAVVEVTFPHTTKMVEKAHG